MATECTLHNTISVIPKILRSCLKRLDIGPGLYILMYQAAVLNASRAARNVSAEY